jgi:hypothetical protein
MNERIYNLIKQSEVSISSVRHFNGHIDINKFAELIIRECIHVAYHKMTIQKLDGVRPSVVCDAIKEHFGVEE